jgi:3-deoxy-D-manno-octulosonic-acid transferase
VGEVGGAKPIAAEIKRRWPDIPVVVSVSTVAGRNLAQSILDDVPVAWFPFDHPWSVRGFLRRLKPRALVLIETEIWPNAVRETRRAGAPVMVMNGRLSDKHFERNRRFRALFRPVAACISAVGAQNQEYAGRFAALGVEAAAIHVTGNTKFDGVITQVDRAEIERLREENGFSPNRPVLLFGSTRPGDEALAARCWTVLRDEFPDLRLVGAPRHTARLAEALAQFHEPVLPRSEVKQGRRPAAERVFVLDTVGELARFYALATISVIGGSFYPGVNGHNPLEPAGLGIPTVFGPYMRNFIDPARELLARRGAVQVASPEELLAVLRKLLADPSERSRVGAQGREAILANQGAIGRSLDVLDTVMRGTP